MREIFISYRRDDAEGQAGRLFDDLTQHFGDDAVFMDVAAIEPGRDFRRAIDQQVASCGVLLAIMGKSWLTAKDESGARRLDDQMDFVRLETASALKRDIPVVPVLVHGARMPRAEDLPEDLKELAFRNGVELTHARWDSDVQVLVKALRPYVQAKQEPARPSHPSAPSEPGPTRKGSSRMIIAALVGVLVLAFGAYVWHQKSSDEAAREVAALEEATSLAAAEEEKAKAEADRINKEKVAADEATARRAKEKEIAAEREERAEKQRAEELAAAQAAAEKAATEQVPSSQTRSSEEATDASAIEGIWYADVSYSWGIRETEQFDFTVDGEHLRGTASFGGAPRRIVNGKLSKGRLYFVTNIESTDGAVTYQYRAQIGDAQIKFTLDNEGTPPTKFVAARSIEEAHRAAPRLSTGGKDPHLSGLETGPYEIAYIRTKVDQAYADVKECYVAAEFDPVDHVYTYYFVKIARDGTVTETGAPGTDQRSVELDRCMDRVFRRVNWGPPPSGSDTQIKLGFKALPDWRVQ